jgi:hypothetical protein
MYARACETSLVRRIGTEERRARLARRHRLAPDVRAETATEVAGDLVGFHGTDPASVFLSGAARTVEPTVEAIERELYDERTLVRMLGMRRTMFVVPVDLAAIIQAACTREIAVGQRTLLFSMLRDAGIAADPGPWLERVERLTLEALAVRGEATATELAADVPELRLQIRVARGKAYEGHVGVSTRVLFLLSADGRIVRGRPRGSWISSQYRWSPTLTWLEGGLAEWPTDAARVELVRRWLLTYGPAPIDDIRWWTGWTMREVRRALGELETVDVELEDGATGIVLADDEEAPGSLESWVALLPALDPSVVGWLRRDWFLGPHRGALFDRSGNVGPTIWANGHIVGGWAQRPSGEIATRLLEDIGREARTAIAESADRLEHWIGPLRVTPRFRPPLEKELSEVSAG